MVDNARIADGDFPVFVLLSHTFMLARVDLSLFFHD